MEYGPGQGLSEEGGLGLVLWWGAEKVAGELSGSSEGCPECFRARTVQHPPYDFNWYVGVYRGRPVP